MKDFIRFRNEEFEWSLSLRRTKIGNKKPRINEVLTILGG